MFSSLFRSAGLALSLLGATLPGQAAGQGAPAPDPLAAVPLKRVVRPGWTVPGTPKALNASITLRYGADRPRAVLLLMPGFLGGAGSFDRLARQIVARDPGLAVWAVDRRSNLLESQDQLAGANPAALQAIAKTGLPARPAAELAFMRDWGLDTTLRDWRLAVQEARTLTPNVFLGGHSLGASLAGLYAGYDFDGVAGARDVRGLVLLDGAPGRTAAQPGGLSPADYQNGFSAGFAVSPGLGALAANPYVQTSFYGPTLAAKAAAQARLAAQDPGAVSPGGLTDFPASNIAAAMLSIDARYAALPFMAVTTGKAVGVRETLSLPALALGGARGWLARAAAGLIDPAQPAEWQQDDGAPTDAQDFVSRFWTPQSDFTEWYFPYRLTLDVSAAGVNTVGTQFAQVLPELHTSGVQVPILGVSAGNGITTPDDYRAYAEQAHSPLTVRSLPGYAHLDVLTAREPTLAGWIVDWVNGVAR